MGFIPVGGGVILSLNGFFVLAGVSIDIYSYRRVLCSVKTTSSVIDSFV
jgi:hypothetical protein